MNNTASVLVLAFLALTFIMSAHNKIFYWNDNMAWLKPHFEKTILKNQVALATGILVVLELIAGILSLSGIVHKRRTHVWILWCCFLLYFVALYAFRTTIG